MATITLDNNKPTNIDINNLINGGVSGAWKKVGNTLVHDNIRSSYIDRPISALEVGETYRVTYTVSIYGNCNVRVYLGDTAGTLRTSAGTFVENLTLQGLKKIRFWANGNVTINYAKIEKLATTIVENIVDLKNSSKAENKSWTLSYNPILEQWLSLHSYLPNNYLIHSNKCLVKRNDSQLKLTNSGAYGSYFDTALKPFILESIFNDNPLYTKVFDNITVNVISEGTNKASTNKFFDKAILNTEYQCSGEIVLDLTNLTKKERDWTIHKFNDLTNNTNNPLFTSDWSDTATQYPIDKIVNTDKIDPSKPWYQRARFRDKFLAVRFIENNFENQKIICKFVSSIFRQSYR